MNRKIIASLMVVGVVGAIAGGSTLALFSDTETSENNVFTAGAVDLRVGWNETYNGEDQGDVNLTDIDEPVFTINDVKPGDEGEATLFWHVYSNPAYVWLRANLTSDDDSSSIEPELATGDAQEDPNDMFDGELAENIQVEMWYDNGIEGQEGTRGDNIRQEGEPSVFTNEVCEAVAVDSVVVFDRSGSMDGPGTTGTNSPPQDPEKLQDAVDGAKLFYNELGADDQGSLVTFGQDGTLEQELTFDQSALNSSSDDIIPIGNEGTNLADGIDDGADELINGSNARPGASKVMVILSDGLPNDQAAAEAAADAAKAEGIRIITIAYGADADPAFLEGLASSPDDAFVADSDGEEIGEVFDQIGQDICEPGTLENLDAALDGGVPLDADLSDMEQTAYPNSTTRHIGFAWNVPLEVGNEAQTDSVAFDIEFYAEQERNNPDPDNPFAS